MGFRNGAYATVWEVTSGSGRCTKVRLSTSRKNKKTDEWEQDFSGYVRFVGDVSEFADTLQERDRIKIGECEVTTRYDKEKQKEYVNYIVYSAEMADQDQQQDKPKEEPQDDEEFVEASIDDDIPFFNQ